MSDGGRRIVTVASAVRHLTWAERAVIFEVSLCVFLARLALKAVSFQRLRKALDRLTAGKPRARDIDTARVLALARLVNAASRHAPVVNTCLHRSLALWWLLRRRGIDGQLRFGARKRNGELEAHAWVEYRSVIVSEDNTQPDEYVPLPWMPAGPDA